MEAAALVLALSLNVNRVDEDKWSDLVLAVTMRNDSRQAIDIYPRVAELGAKSGWAGKLPRPGFVAFVPRGRPLEIRARYLQDPWVDFSPKRSFFAESNAVLIQTASEIEEPRAWAPRSFVILKSTPSYAEARRVALAAATKLDVKLDLRGLSPNRQLGLTSARATCENEVGSYPCYAPRGRYDQGVYVSIEHSSGYASFKKGLYIVVLASGAKDDEVVKAALERARTAYPDAYAKTTDVYLGCMH